MLAAASPVRQRKPWLARFMPAQECWHKSGFAQINMESVGDTPRSITRVEPGAGVQTHDAIACEWFYG